MRQTSMQPPYTAVPLEDLPKENSQHSRQAAHQLNRSWTTAGLQLLSDLVLATFAFLFVIFAIVVYRENGKPATEGSTGLKLFQTAQFAPTIFPILFAAIASKSIRSIVLWSLQSSHGMTLGMVGQCLGSQTISSAFTAQVKLRAINITSILIVCLWALSPVGSQASLRIISIEPAFPSYVTELRAINTSNVPLIGPDAGHDMGKDLNTIGNPTIASMMAAQLLSRQNQDLWGNIRIPDIESLEKDKQTNTWLRAPADTYLTYPSLVGIPVSRRPNVGNTSFTLPGSYVSLSCSAVRHSNISQLTVITDPSVQHNRTDMCGWVVGGDNCNMTQVATTKPCYNNTLPRPNGKRHARSLIFEQVVERGLGPELATTECSLTTTFVDANITCTGATVGNVCNATALRRSSSPLFPTNYTVLDLGPLQNGGPHDNFDDTDSGTIADSIIYILVSMFSSNGIPCERFQNPLVAYLIQPDQGLTELKAEGDGSIFTLSKDVFSRTLEQLLNTILYVGIDPASFTGSFNGSLKKPDSMITVAATSTSEQDIVRCSKAWFGFLLITSLVLLFCALGGTFLRLATIAPDILGSLSIALLRNQVRNIRGSSTWSSEEWARELKHVRLYLGDIEPEGEVGRIAFATDGRAASIKAERYYM